MIVAHGLGADMALSGPSGFGKTGVMRILASYKSNIGGIMADKKTEPKKKANCRLCQKPVDAEDSFCHGCKNNICEECAVDLTLGKFHGAKDHKYCRGCGEETTPDGCEFCL